MRVTAVHGLDVVAALRVHIDARAVRPGDRLVLFAHLAGEFGACRIGGLNAAHQGALAALPGSHIGVEETHAESAGGVQALWQVGVDEGAAEAQAEAFHLFRAQRVGVFPEPLGGVHGEVDDAGYLEAVVVLAGNFFQGADLLAWVLVVPVEAGAHAGVGEFGAGLHSSAHGEFMGVAGGFVHRQVDEEGDDDGAHDHGGHGDEPAAAAPAGGLSVLVLLRWGAVTLLRCGAVTLWGCAAVTLLGRASVTLW